MPDTRREEEVLNLLEQLKRHVTPAGQGIYRTLERGFAEFTTEIIALKMVANDPGAVDRWRRQFKATKTESAVMAALEAAGENGLTYEGLYAAIYGSLPECDQPDPDIVKVYVCRMRRKIEGSQFRIDTVNGKGYALTEEKVAA